ncbi:MAG: choloylglycine hydrolase family protein [Rickettsiales bacterium]|nr:choloylglycine hydrolase family protein [Rickettsiales bacterium]
MKKLFLSAIFILPFWDSLACTGISLVAADGAQIVARTIEWGGSELDSRYIIVPRGHIENAMLQDGANGLEISARYGYVGLSVERPEFIAEGINEAGLAAGLFYFPGYGEYGKYDASRPNDAISDLQLVAWMLANFRTIDEVKNAIGGIQIVSIDPRADTLHWRIADASGRQVVLEITDGGTAHFYENPVGVLTNSPGFEWHITNLNNYVNLRPGNAAPQNLRGAELKPLGAGTGFLGLPGDMTPPSRFVRAVFLSANARPKNAADAVTSGFHIMNNFDLVPLGSVADMPSATQWTAVTDITNRAIYYRTMYDASIRKIDLNKIDFATAAYRTAPLDNEKRQPVLEIEIN